MLNEICSCNEDERLLLGGKKFNNMFCNFMEWVDCNEEDLKKELWRYNYDAIYTIVHSSKKETVSRV